MNVKIYRSLFQSIICCFGGLDHNSAQAYDTVLLVAKVLEDLDLEISRTHGRSYSL